ncbi:gamma-aminobutyric acid receptor subunit beta-like isoform X1 [Dermacentor variabilis]|uniref:gamma-aminobutyric acid receptor subunit beta-like isoform X1 n=1 Tax=Dermacentor variabilis TaxID=34621 RepID=UPI0018977AE6
MRQAMAFSCWSFVLFVAVAVTSAGRDNGPAPLQPGQTQRGQNITQILNAFFTRGYDKRVRPNYGGVPVEVGVTMQIISISTVSEVQMDFTSDFYFRQSWRDERLSFQKSPDLESMTVGAEVAEKIWVPDTFFANEKSAYFHAATTPNTFLRIGSGGEVFRSIRLTVTASCPMDLRYFPMDRQACTIEIESFGYTMKDIRYRWSDGDTSVRIAKEVELPQFKVLGHVQKAKEVALTTGNYSRLVCEIRFVRSMGYYLIQIYIPASLIVVISWVSFWLHRNATPARVSLGVTTVLTMTTLMSSTNAALPKISYVKSIDIYLGTCFVMVFASLLEYATVGYLGKRIAMRKARCQQLAKLAEEHRQKRANAASAGEAGSEPLLASPEVPVVKTVGSCQVCPAAVASQGQPREAPPTGFTMGRRGADQCCPGLQGSCQVCPAAVASQTQQQAPPPGIPMNHKVREPYRTMVVMPSRNCHITGCHEVRLKMVDPKGFSKSSTLENTVNGAPDIEAAFCKNPNKLFGVSPSDIDKYSRVVFPVCFVCFNLMYWIIYLHISDVLPDDVGDD